MIKTLKKLSYIFFFLLILNNLFPSTTRKLRLYSIKNGRNGYSILADNNHLYPIQIKLQFKKLQNLKANVALPYTTVIPAKKSKYLLLRLNKIKNASYGFRYSYIFSPGDYRRKPNLKFIYLFPYKHGTKCKLSQGYFGKYSHKGFSDYALDFDMDEGTPIYASRGGIVVDVKQDSNIGGPNESFASYGNYISIFHVDGTFAKYLHLKQNGSAVKIGQKVKQGSLIGYSGNTGWSSGPHLHFQIERPVIGSLTTIPTSFYFGKKLLKKLIPGHFYYATHYNKKSFKRKFGRLLTNTNFKNHKKSTLHTNKLQIFNVKYDDTTVFFVKNGFRKKVTLWVELKNIENIICSKKIPYKCTIQPLTEVYLFLIKPAMPTKGWKYAYQYKYRR